MSISDFDLKWIKFTKSLRTVGVLLIFVIIPYLAFVIIPFHFIFAMVSLRELKNMNRELNDGYLNSFYSKYLTASIFKLFGSILVHIGAAMVVIFNSPFNPFYYAFYGWFSTPITVFVIGFIIMIIGSGVEVGAWDNLKLFIHYNEALFPERINFDTTTKVESLRRGALSWALGFIVITIIIGWILQLVGYFGLNSVAERVMKSESIAPVTHYHQPTSIPTQEQQPVGEIEFCPMCGASVAEGASYCANCGVKILN